MLGVTPVVQSYLMRTTDWGITGTGFAASLIGGAFAGGVSAPMDTIKTCMQGDMRKQKHKGCAGSPPPPIPHSPSQGWFV